MSVRVPARVIEEGLALEQFLEAMFRVPDVVPVQTPAEVAVETAAAERSAAAFQVLLADVGVLTLALPLAELAGLSRWPGELQRLPGLAPWVRGVFVHRGTPVRLVDTVALMALGGPVAAPDYRQVVLLGDGRWALACHAGAAVRTVDPEQVSWRDRRGARPWLAGTLREGLHPLIGARALERWLDGTLA